jgi:deoxyribose-phosphate aldolase
MDAALRLAADLDGRVDAVGLESRATVMGSRSLKGETKLALLDLAIRCCDLTTLEGDDSPGKIRALAAKAQRPVPGDPDVPAVAALCVYPRSVPDAVRATRDSPVRVASVAGGFPAGQLELDGRVAEADAAARAGADEIDMVISRGALLAGDEPFVVEEVAAIKDTVGHRTLKVILETGELGSYDQIRRAAMLVMAAGADMVKTSTGKIQPGATLPVALVLARAVRDFGDATGRIVGLKVAGGVRTAKDALRYLVVVAETLGPDWLAPERFRIGASTLLNDLLMQRDAQLAGRYSNPDRYTVD